jgi:hypothetical protein
VEWAQGQFRAAGLNLPVVEISFSTDADDCDGEQGVYRRRGGTHSVTVCVPDLQGAAIEHRRRRTLLHELAHAWDHATLTDVDRELLLPDLEATDWYDPDAAWDQRGVERLAETLTWGLLDQKRRPLKIDTDCAAIHVDFITITGSAVLGPIDRICEIDLALPGPAGGTATATTTMPLMTYETHRPRRVNIRSRRGTNPAKLNTTLAARVMQARLVTNNNSAPSVRSVRPKPRVIPTVASGGTNATAIPTPGSADPVDAHR